MDFNKIVTEKLNDYIDNGSLSKKLDTAIDNMMNEIVKDIFREYSDTAKEIKKKISEKLDVNLQRYDLLDYNAMVAKAINDNLIAKVNENAIKPILEMVNNTIGFVNATEMKISEIQEMIRDFSMKDSSDSEGAFTFIVRQGEYDWNKNDYIVCIDTEGGKDANECDFEFRVSKEGKMFSFGFASWRGSDKLKPITPAKFASIGKLEAAIFRLYSAQVKIIMDVTDFDQEDNYWSRYD